MIKDLIKLADFLDQHQKKQMADAVDQMVENLVKDPPPAPLPKNPMNAPRRTSFEGDISGEWDAADVFDFEDLPTEVMEPAEMAKQHKPSRGIVKAIHQLLSRWAQHPISIEWHIPGTEPGVNAGEQEGEPPYWMVIARSDDPTDVPDDNYWSMWEVNPGDENWEAGIPIDGSQTKLYGEW